MARWPSILLGSAISLVASIVSAAPAPADDLVVRLPPLYNTFTPPLIGQTYTDPVFGVAIKRVSDAPNMTNNAVSGPLSFVSTEYSTASPWNSDNTLLVVQHAGYFGLYDGAGTYLRDLPFAVNASTEPRWSRTDPNALFYVTANKLMKLDVVAQTSTTVHTFSEYAAIRGRGESDISRDGDHFVFAGDAPGGLTNRYVFVYEISTDTKGAVLDTIGHPYNQLYIAPNNGVAIGWLADGTARFTGIEFFDRNMVFQRQLTHAIGHMHLTRDPGGDDLLVWTNSNDSQPIPNCQNGIVKVRLANAQQTCLLQLDWSLAVHITAGDGNNWVFVETYDPADPPAVLPNWKLHSNEVLQIKLDGTEVRRLFHHRSRATSNYAYQPRATVSRDGKKLLFTSNYGLQTILGYPNGYTDAYFVAVPNLPPPHISINDVSVTEGNASTTNAVFTVTLSSISDLTVSVDYATGDLRAHAPEDYTAIPETRLTFAPGETSKTITVSVNGDTLYETTETFAVNLTNPMNLVIDDGFGRGTIVNDDLPQGDGLLGTYFPNTTLSGPSQTRIDPTVNYDWGTGGPGVVGMGADQFSVRWTGLVEAAFTENYTFCTRTDDGVRLWVNYQLLVDKWVNQTLTEWCGSAPLEAGHRYDVVMEYFENTGTSLAQLFWNSARTPKTIIPQGYLHSRPEIQHRRTLGVSSAVRSSELPSDVAFETTMTPLFNDSMLQVETIVADNQAAQFATTPGQAPMQQEPAAVSRNVEAPKPQATRFVFFAPNPENSLPEESRPVPAIASDKSETARNESKANWTGQVEALYTELYSFCTSAREGARLRVNDELLVGRSSHESTGELCGSTALAAGRKYDITIEYSREVGDSNVQLFWSSPSTPRSMVPKKVDSGASR